ncbi:MAG: methionyl-tRNA formyltransferase [Cyclobacteriaceae bacterium]|nr:methionyl-tRNA formyltransferase [Cyclobacteriaceae bacterium]
MKSLRIVFMGTPEFAVPSLEKLVANRYEVVGVITAPDKPQGRGQKLTPSPVKAAALKHGLNVLQPTNLKAPEFIETLRSLDANLQVVVAFRMLPEVVWSMPPLGTFNLHASLLPQYRGAAPINWAIIRGEKETGATTFFLQHEIDTGKIIFQEKEPILDTDNAGSLYDRLMVKGADLVLRTVQAIESGNFPQIPQVIQGEQRLAPKIFKETCEINWNQSSVAVRNFVRGLSPYPAAWCTVGGKVFKILKVSEYAGPSAAPGHLETDHKTYLRICTANGWISIEELQPEGKRRMTITEFFNGNKLETNPS